MNDRIQMFLLLLLQRSTFSVLLEAQSEAWRSSSSVSPPSRSFSVPRASSRLQLYPKLIIESISIGSHSQDSSHPHLLTHSSYQQTHACVVSSNSIPSFSRTFFASTHIPLLATGAIQLQLLPPPPSQSSIVAISKSTLLFLLLPASHG